MYYNFFVSLHRKRNSPIALGKQESGESDNKRDGKSTKSFGSESKFFIHGIRSPGKERLLMSTLAGLFISQTIECSQLIWQWGTFDVNDLLNNTIGALLGGAAVVLAMAFRLRRKL